jgi:hypothetical protein
MLQSRGTHDPPESFDYRKLSSTNVSQSLTYTCTTPLLLMRLGATHQRWMQRLQLHSTFEVPESGSMWRGMDGWMDWGGRHMACWRGDAYQADGHDIDLLMATEVVVTTAPDLEEEDVPTGSRGRRQGEKRTWDRSKLNLGARAQSPTHLLAGAHRARVKAQVWFW